MSSAVRATDQCATKIHLPAFWPVFTTSGKTLSLAAQDNVNTRNCPLAKRSYAG